MINDDSITLKQLTAIKQDRMLVCETLQKRLRTTIPVYDLCTSLELQSVELPRERILDKTKCHMAFRDLAEKRQITQTAPHCYGNDFDTVTVARRFQCVAIADVWMHYARFLSLKELVVLIDNLTRRDRRLKRTTLEYLHESLKKAGRFQGRRKCLQALRLAKENTDSSYETRGRLALMQYGLPCPEVNYPVKLANVTALLDMAYPIWRICIEYDGRHHAAQWKDDNRRREQLERKGWVIIKLFAEDLADDNSEERAALRVAQAIEQVTGKPFPLTSRQTLERLSDGRRWRHNTLQCGSSLSSDGDTTKIHTDLNEYDAMMRSEAFWQSAERPA
ncbi:DUF559 domain-containing protein [Bifidobacterium callimiconis]|uniref:DUF559 domain-containing protein n=1 Tax=Bifidobacterium callimiconis TaxID=2306973 RepID=A0A430FBJ2_9BIFI|nr:DUF559 domain-containing protein [Bifidobacterium callimiconis]MBT1177169.1 DUF559 domain-containing protein [Bifidobacterium callimiconis]RSX50215.1 hypothetical protein D2E23_1763 [Bifidobacterium callimiconis]